MALVTGSPIGNVLTQDELYVQSAPPIYYQDSDAGSGPGTVGLLNPPDGNGFHWGLSGTVNNPVYQLGCVTDVAIAGNIEMNNIRCDTVGDKGVIQRLNFIDVTFTLQTLFPLTSLRAIIRGGAVTTASGLTEQMGIGQPNNNKYYYVWLPSVYDEDSGDYLAWTGFRGQFVDSWQLSFTYAQNTSLGVTLRLFADESKPADQLFASILRADASAIA